MNEFFKKAKQISEELSCAKEKHYALRKEIEVWFSKLEWKRIGNIERVNVNENGDIVLTIHEHGREPWGYTITEAEFEMSPEDYVEHKRVENEQLKLAEEEEYDKKQLQKEREYYEKLKAKFENPECKKISEI